jgi:hypothetical protein
MESRRVYELAKELNIDPKEVVSLLRALGAPVINHMSPVSSAYVARVRWYGREVIPREALPTRYRAVGRSPVSASGPARRRVPSSSAGAAAAIVAHGWTGGARAAADERHAGRARLHAEMRIYAGASERQRAGRAAEEWHATEFNADAAAKRLPIRGRTTASMGRRRAAADIELTHGERAAQVKYYGTAKSTATHLAREAYDTMQKVVPADQRPGVRNHSARRSQDPKLATRAPARATSMRHTAGVVSDRLRGGGAQSRPLSNAGARALARDPDILARTASHEYGAALKAGAVSAPR